jgi:hypothetical protein
MAKRREIATVELAALPAAVEYIMRRDRQRKPDGSGDRGGRWFPSTSERCWCCAYVRTPSRTWPLSLLKHCSSAEHVAALLGVDEDDLRMLARLIDKARKDGREDDFQAWLTLARPTGEREVVAAAERLGIPVPTHHAPAAAEVFMDQVIARANPRESDPEDARNGL